MFTATLGADPRRSAEGNRVSHVTVNMNTLPAQIDAEEAALGPPTATARRLVEASVR